MTDAELKKMRDWADAKLAAGEEPPWAWFRYMQLRETLDFIIAGRAATLAEGQHLRLVEPEPPVMPL